MTRYPVMLPGYPQVPMPSLEKSAKGTEVIQPTLYHNCSQLPTLSASDTKAESLVIVVTAGVSSVPLIVLAVPRGLIAGTAGALLVFGKEV